MAIPKKNLPEAYDAPDPGTDAIDPGYATMLAQSGTEPPVPTISAPKPVLVPRPISLPESKMQLAVEVRNHWSVFLPKGLRATEIHNPIFWAHVARKLRRHDRIEAMADDGTFLMDLLVINTGLTSTQVVVLNHWDIDVVKDEDDLIHFEIENLASLGWCVNRKSDGARISERHSSKTAAMVWATENGKLHLPKHQG